MTWWAPLLGAILAGVAGLLAADLLTARTRIRRRLDKELAILDRMPDGYGKDQLNRIVQRDALDLIHRSLPRRPNEIDWFWRANLGLGVVVVTFYFTLMVVRISSGVPFGDPWTDPELVGVPLLALGMVGFAVHGIRVKPRAERARFVSEHLGPERASQPRLGRPRSPRLSPATIRRSRPDRTAR